MKKHVLITLFDLHIGGIERSLINMLEHFDYEHYHVDLLIFHHTGDLMQLIPKQVHLLPPDKRLSVFRKPIRDCVTDRQYISALLRLVSKYVAFLQARSQKLKEGSGYIQMQLILRYFSWFLPKIRKRYDIAISYAWPHDIVARKVQADKKIAWIHTDYSELEIDNELDLQVWKKFDYIASISPACTSAFVSKYPVLKEKIVEIDNINSPAHIKESAKQTEAITDIPAQSERIFTLVSVGRLSYVKGFDMAIEALRRLHDKGYTAIKWFVVGYGGHEEHLRQLIEHHQLQNSFFLLGKKSNPYPYIQACDLYVQPSRYEGKAVTVTEAKILQKPILITHYPTSTSQVRDGVDGMICPLSVDGLVEGIEFLFRNESYRNRLVQNLETADYSNRDELQKLYRLMQSRHEILVQLGGVMHG